VGGEVDGLGNPRVFLHGGDAFAHGFGGGVHLTSTNYLLVGGDEEVRTTVCTAFLFVTLVECRILPYGLDADFRGFFAFIGLTGEDDLVIRGFQIEYVICPAALLISNVALIGFYHLQSPLARRNGSSRQDERMELMRVDREPAFFLWG
jgi:hypothetical protein